jgi:hypothetical protein
VGDRHQGPLHTSGIDTVLTAAHIFTCLFTLVLCVPLSSVLLMPFSIFEPTSAEWARPWHSDTYTNALDVDIPVTPPPPLRMYA